jgi:ribosomal protein S18 acetylase RimI-like enzyme
VTTAEKSISLRPATVDDQEFLLALYKSSRGDDLRGLGWEEERIDDFLEMQYAAYQNFLTSDHPDIQDQIVLSFGEPVGHLAVEHRPEEIRLVDVSLIPEQRQHGTGTLLIQELQTQAAAAKRPLRLQVIRFSRAVGLFERLGFRRTSETGSHFQMEWLLKS